MKEEVRQNATSCLARLYNGLAVQWGRINKWTEEQYKLYSWIPKKIVHCLYIPTAQDRLVLHDIFLTERCRVEKVFQEELLPETEKASTQAKFMIDVFSTFDDNAISAVCHLLKEKQSYVQTLHTNYI